MSRAMEVIQSFGMVIIYRNACHSSAVPDKEIKK